MEQFSCNKYKKIKLDGRATAELYFQIELTLAKRLQCLREHEKALSLIQSALSKLDGSGFERQYRPEFLALQAYSRAILKRRPELYATICAEQDIQLPSSADIEQRLECRLLAAGMYQRCGQYSEAISQIKAAQAILLMVGLPSKFEETKINYLLLRREAAALLAGNDAIQASERLADGIRKHWFEFIFKFVNSSTKQRKILLSNDDNPIWGANLLVGMPFQFQGVSAELGLYAQQVNRSFSWLAAGLQRRTSKEELYDSLIRARRRFAALSLGTRHNAHSGALRSEVLRAREEVLTAGWKLQQDRYLFPNSIPQASEFVEKLGDHEAAIEYVRYFPIDCTEFHRGTTLVPPPTQLKANYGAFIFSRNAPRGMAVDLGPAAVIDEAVFAYRDFMDLQIRSGRLSASDERMLAEKGNSIRRLVLDPLVHRIPNKKRLFITQAGPLTRIPFEVLPLMDSIEPVRYMAEKIEFVYLSQMRDLSLFPSKNIKGSIWVVANPDYGPQVWPSNDTKELNRYVHTHWSSRDFSELVLSTKRLAEKSGLQFRSLEGSQATEDNVLGIHSAKALLFATHGLFIEDPIRLMDPNPIHLDVNQVSDAIATVLSKDPSNPGAPPQNGRTGEKLPEIVPVDTIIIKNPLMRSFLVLANANRRPIETPKSSVDDGILTAYETLGMDLKGTELVVLAACESGLAADPSDTLQGISETRITIDTDEPEQEAVSGLRGAFIHAGARAVVFSLWEIPEIESRRQVTDLFDMWLGKGYAPYKAFHSAMERSLERSRREHGSGHPFWWGGWTFAGATGEE